MAVNLKDDYTKVQNKQYIYKHKTNNTYAVKIFVNDKIYNKRVPKLKINIKTISEANDYIAEIKVMFKNKENKNIETITFKEAFSEYISECKLEVKKGNLSENTVNGKETIFKNQILPKLGKVNLSKMNEEHIRKFQDDLLQMENMRIKGKKLDNATLIKVHKQLSAFLNVCVKKRLIPYNPARNVGNFKKEKKIQPFLELEEFKHLLSFVDNIRDYFILLFLFCTGLRIGELLALTTDDIICVNGKTLLTINKTYSNGKISNRTKTDESMGDLFLDEVVVKFYNIYLEYRKEKGIKSKYLFPSITNSGNSPVLSDSAVRDMLKKYLELANIEEHITPHKLRHSHAAFLKSLGKDLEDIKNRLRHKDIRTTSNEYGHLYNSKKIELADDISKCLIAENIEITDFCNTQCNTQ